jgi:hypothetical protein
LEAEAGPAPDHCRLEREGRIARPVLREAEPVDVVLVAGTWAMPIESVVQPSAGP